MTPLVLREIGDRDIRMGPRSAAPDVWQRGARAGYHPSEFDH
jgi:hypothetical protein